MKFRISSTIPVDYLKLIGMALVLSILSVILSSSINSAAFEVHPMIGDNGVQYAYSAASYLDFLYNGRFQAIWNAYSSSPRPIWIILPLIFEPRLLVDVNGHIIVGGVFLFFLLAVMGIAIHRRTGSVFYAFFCILVVLSAEKFYHFRMGMGGNYTDLQTAWLIGAALFALINSEEASRGIWLVLFSLFSALAQQSRFVSLGVTAAVCGPILGWFLLKRWRFDRSGKALLISLAQALIPLIVISGYSLIKFFHAYIETYFLSPVVSSGLIHMFKSTEAAMALFLKVYDYHLGTLGVASLLLLFITYLIIYWQARAGNASLFVSLWAAIAFPLVHIFILRIADEWIYTVYMLPGFYLLAFTPFNLSAEKLQDAGPKFEIPKLLYFGLSIIIVFVTINNFHKLSQSVKSISELDQKIFNYQRDLSTVLVRLTDKYYPISRTIEDVPSFESFVEIREFPSAQPVYIDTWYQYHRPIRWINLSRVWKSMYQMAYPSQSFDEIQESIYQETLKSVDFAVVLSDARNEKAVSLSNLYPQLESDEWNLKMNEYMYKQLSENRQDWIREQILGQLAYKSPFGNIYIFRNLNRYAKRNR